MMGKFRSGFDWMRFVINTGSIAFAVMFIYLGGNHIGWWGGPTPEGIWLPGYGPMAVGFTAAFFREVWAYRSDQS